MDTSISDSADYLSINCFLNAYVREFDDWRYCDSPLPWQAAGFPEGALVIPLGHQTLWIGVLYWSACGRHRFTLPARCEGTDPKQSKQVGFLALAKKLVDNAGIQANGTIGAMARFLERIMESHRNLEMLLALRDSEVDALFQSPLAFRDAEQALLIGHSVHPAPKVRQPMTLTEAVQFGPEGGSGFALAWMLVRRERLKYHSADATTLQQRVNALIESDPMLTGDYADVPDGYQLIPAHPWQLEKLKKLPQLQQAFADRDVVALGVQGQKWYATSSMRSIYTESAPYMLKFSLSVRLTNSVRHLQPAEAERGCLISKVLSTAVGQQFTKRFQQFSIMEEPAYLCLLDDAGMPVSESMMVFRDNSILHRAKLAGCQEQHNVLATLTQDHPSGSASRLAQLVGEVSRVQNISRERAAIAWFDAYLDVVVKPLLLAQADYGMLFGAHQQNIVLAIAQGMPVHCYFRDCQGTGFSDVGVRLFKLDQQALGEAAENQVQQAMANKLFAYYLIINSTFGVISALGVDQCVAEQTLISSLRDFLLRHRTAQRQDQSFIDYVLESDVLWQKGNFVCSLSDLNENTMSDPLSIYRAIPNPVADVAITPAQNSDQLITRLIC